MPTYINSLTISDHTRMKSHICAHMDVGADSARSATETNTSSISTVKKKRSYAKNVTWPSSINIICSNIKSKHMATKYKKIDKN